MKLLTLLLGVGVVVAQGPAQPEPPRTGLVRLGDGQSVDADGAWPALGTTLFWALRGERHEPERLDRNLAFTAAQGVDYVRVLAMVGSESWSDRRVDPAWPDYWDIVDRLFARAARHHLRLQVVLFADAQVMMSDPARRGSWVDRWAARVSRAPEHVILIEIANEYWQNGFARPADVAALARRARAGTRVLVASSAPRCGAYPAGETTGGARSCADEWRTLHAGAADVAVPHFDRDIRGVSERQGPICGPLTMRHVPREVVGAFVNNEPIGPQSSVEQEPDPERLALAARVTWAVGGAAYTLHTGAGVRGGGAADRAMGRSANLWEVPRILEIFAALRREQRAARTGQGDLSPCGTL